MKRKLKYYGGSGFPYAHASGKYEIRYGDDKVKNFTSFVNAFHFYSDLTVEKAFWDLTITPELIDAYTYQP
jgi:hypothetical protein